MEEQSKFWEATAASFTAGTLVKLTCGKPRRKAAETARNVYVRPVEIRGEEQLQFTYRYQDREEAKNFSFEEGLAKLQATTETYQHFDLFTLNRQLNMLVSRKGQVRLRELNARHREPAMTTHNREKNREITADRPYLYALGITDARGKVTASGRRKFKQINKFVEIIDGLVRSNPLPRGATVVDMGSGSGYLTFALYDHLVHNLDLDVRITGVELRPKLVEKCNEIARKSGFHDLNFVEGYIDTYAVEKIDLLIALHACDTATDDAIKVGADAGASVIVVAPCCQKQVRRAMDVPPELKPFLDHGILLERQAAMLTDAIRALLLQAAGYDTKLFEFIPLEHTAKNVMITAVKSRPRKAAVEEVAVLKNKFGISRHYLEDLLQN